MLWRIVRYIAHQFYRRHRKGHHIHSPYLFEFVHEAVFNASGNEVPAAVRETHRLLRNDRQRIPAVAGDPGAGSRMKFSELHRMGSFVRKASVSRKYGALLYRISLWFRPEVILELGTGTGVSTLYLSAGAPGVPLHTIEGNAARANFSEQLFKRCGLTTVQVHVGEMEQMLEASADAVKGRLLAFVDANHRYGPTLGYIRWILRQAGEEAVIVMDDIYWSKEMFLAWKEVTSWEEVPVSIDLYSMGILLLRRDLNKVKMKIKF
jgi:predicted O-methyltransferase YrrM